jgi:hypothetical protein
MKNISQFLVLCVLFQSIAWAAPKDSLKTIVDEHRYALTVEWDQKDQAQYIEIKDSFDFNILRVIQAEGLMLGDIQEYLSENSFNLKLTQESLTRIEHAGNISAIELKKILEHSLNQTYMRGSQWAPEVTAVIGITVLTLLFGAMMLAKSYADECHSSNSYNPNNVPYTCE